MEKKCLLLKWLLTLLIFVYVALSCFPCVEKIGSIDRYDNNITVFMLVALALQILLLWCNRSRLQLPVGLLGIFPGLLLPLTANFMSWMQDIIVYVRANPYAYTEAILTPVGWCVTVLAWTLLAADIYLAVTMQKCRTAIKNQSVNAVEERDEVVL